MDLEKAMLSKLKTVSCFFLVYFSENVRNDKWRIKAVLIAMLYSLLHISLFYITWMLAVHSALHTHPMLLLFDISSYDLHLLSHHHPLTLPPLTSTDHHTSHTYILTRSAAATTPPSWRACFKMWTSLRSVSPHTRRILMQTLLILVLQENSKDSCNVSKHLWRICCL